MFSTSPLSLIVNGVCFSGHCNAHPKANDSTQESAGICRYPLERIGIDVGKSCLVEELKLPDIMFYTSNTAGR